MQDKELNSKPVELLPTMILSLIYNYTLTSHAPINHSINKPHPTGCV